MLYCTINSRRIKMSNISKDEIVRICSIKPSDFRKNKPRMKYRIVKDSAGMGDLMSDELVNLVAGNNRRGLPTRAIVPCGPMAWYRPFCEKVNKLRLSLGMLTVFHMDECLDWQGRVLPKEHPFSFRGTMERVFYSPVDRKLAVPEEQRIWMEPDNLGHFKREFWKAPVDICLGGWGQDGHLAYNQARREPYSQLTIADLLAAEARIQNNNWDTVMALAHRNFGAAYQLVPPMSCTIGIKECMAAKKIRIFSDTGAWKQTAFRAALFAEPCCEYPITLLQRHKDAIITATEETADHPLCRHPEWVWE
jgi:glucosamine-6-phosphate deaminase